MNDLRDTAKPPRARARVTSRTPERTVERLPRTRRALDQLEAKTAKRELRNQQLLELCERFRERAASTAELLERAPIGLVRLDARGLIVDLNDIAASLLGRKRKNLVGVSFGSLLETAEARRFMAHLRSRGPRLHALTTELRLRRAHEGISLLRCQSAPLRDKRQRVRCARVEPLRIVHDQQ